MSVTYSDKDSAALRRRSRTGWDRADQSRSSPRLQTTSALRSDARCRLARLRRVRSESCGRKGARTVAIYAEMFLPHDLTFNCQAVLLRDADRIVRTSVTRTKREGPLDADALRVFTSLLPYVRASARFQATLEHAKLDAALMALNAISAAAFLLDGAGRVVGASAAGEKLATQQSVVRVSCKRLQPHSRSRAPYV
jgi:hypothetical protein